MYSFIVPFFNADKYLSACIESVMAQTSDNWELLLVDDGSTDKSGEICDAYAAKNEKIYAFHQPNSGVSVARNVGLTNAKGEWLIFLDADDFVEKDLCERMNKVITDEIDMVFYTYYEDMADKQKKHIKKDMEENATAVWGEEEITLMQKAILYKHLCNFTSAGSPWAKAFKKSLIEEYGIGYVKGIKKGQDHLFNFEVFEHAKKAVFLNAPLYHYRINSESVRHKYNPNIVPIIKSLYDNKWKLIEKYHKDEEYVTYFYYGAFRQFMIDSMLNFCHPDNPKSYGERRKEFLLATKEEPFQTSLKRANLKGWPKKERILGFMFKHKLFAGICLLNFAKDRTRKTF